MTAQSWSPVPPRDELTVVEKALSALCGLAVGAGVAVWALARKVGWR